MQKYKSLMRNITGCQITCFWTSTFKQYIFTINPFKEWSFDRKCKVQLSDENKILMVKSMLEKYRKYKCCVFIDFEYNYIVRTVSYDDRDRLKVGSRMGNVLTGRVNFVEYLRNMRLCEN